MESESFFDLGLTNLFYGLNLTDMETWYKDIRADILKSLKLRVNRFTFEPEVTVLLAKKRIKILEIPISYHDRTAKEGKKSEPKISSTQCWFYYGILFDLSLII